jgi:hypothetical protein
MEKAIHPEIAEAGNGCRLAIGDLGAPHDTIELDEKLLTRT